MILLAHASLGSSPYYLQYKKERRQRRCSFFGAADRTRRRFVRPYGRELLRNRQKSIIWFCLLTQASVRVRIFYNTKKSVVKRRCSFFGAADRTRTDTAVTPRDFKSLASAYSATAALKTVDFFMQMCNNIISWFLSITIITQTSVICNSFWLFWKILWINLFWSTATVLLTELFTQRRLWATPRANTPTRFTAF